MSEQSFTTTVTVAQSPADVFAAVTNVRGWWSAHLEGESAKAGDEFVYTMPGIHRTHARIVEAVPNERVVWKVLDNWMSFVDDQAEWPGTTIRFDIAKTGDETTLRFTHEGLTPDWECYDQCFTGWSFYVDESLRDLITTGTGQPSEHTDPAVARAWAGFDENGRLVRQ